jgi:hypothetical protein
VSKLRLHGITARDDYPDQEPADLCDVSTGVRRMVPTEPPVPIQRHLVKIGLRSFGRRDGIVSNEIRPTLECRQS